MLRRRREPHVVAERGFTSKREAQRFLRDVLADLKAGSYIAPEKLTVGQWLEDEWLPSRKPAAATARGHRGTVSLSTWEQYRTYVRAYVVPYLGHIALQQLVPADLDRLYDRLEAPGPMRDRRGDLPRPRLLPRPPRRCRTQNAHEPARHPPQGAGRAVKRAKVKRNVADLVLSTGSSGSSTASPLSSRAPRARRVHGRWRSTPRRSMPCESIGDASWRSGSLPDRSGRTNRPTTSGRREPGSSSPGRMAASSTPSGSPPGFDGTAWRRGSRRYGSTTCGTPTPRQFERDRMARGQGNQRAARPRERGHHHRYLQPRVPPAADAATAHTLAKLILGGP